MKPAIHFVINAWMISLMVIISLGFASTDNKPSVPTHTYVKVFNDDDVYKIAEHINVYAQKGYIVKTVSLSNNASFRNRAIVVMEKY